MSDNYVNEMDWSRKNEGFSIFNNYRNYQFNLIKKYIGINILEVGTGDRSFTEQFFINLKPNYNVVSIEPSETLFKLGSVKSHFPDNFQFLSEDLFNIGNKYKHQFDTVVMIHVLEHIKNHKEALNHIHSLLSEKGFLLIQVPSHQWLFSEHDVSLGHYRRYNKKTITKIVDIDKYKIVKIWHQDPIGILGSLYYFKFKKTKLKSLSGDLLVRNQGYFYDKYIIPFESIVEKFITFPFGLNLTLILQKI